MVQTWIALWCSRSLDAFTWRVLTYNQKTPSSSRRPWFAAIVYSGLHASYGKYFYYRNYSSSLIIHEGCDLQALCFPEAGKACVSLLWLTSGWPSSVLRVLDAMVFTWTLTAIMCSIFNAHALRNDDVYQEESMRLINNMCLIASAPNNQSLWYTWQLMVPLHGCMRPKQLQALPLLCISMFTNLKCMCTFVPIQF